MIKISIDGLEIEGNAVTVVTEAALLLKTIKEHYSFPAVLSCVYTDAGNVPLKDAVEDYKADTAEVIKHMETIYKRKGGTND